MISLREKKANEKTVRIVAIALFIVSLALMGFISKLEIDGINGLITQLQVLLSVGLVIMAPEKGFKTARIMNIIVMVYILMFGVLLSRNLGALPGAVSPLITILICYIIDSYAKAADKANEELKNKNRALKQTNKEITKEGEKLSQMAYSDALTGLANRQMCIKAMNEMLEAKTLTPFAVIFANIDDFSAINKSLGKDMGDIVLGTFSYRIKNFCTGNDTVARVDGDEFAIIMPGKHTKDSINSFILDISGELCAPININGKRIDLSVSFGVAMHPGCGTNAELILANAEKAVNSAKTDGKGNVAFAAKM